MRVASPRPALADGSSDLSRAVSESVTGSASADDLLEGLVTVLMEAGGWDLAQVWSPTADRSHLVCAAVFSSGASEELALFSRASRLLRCPVGSGLPGSVFASQEPEWLSDVTREESFLRNAYLSEGTVLSGIAVPVVVARESVAVIEMFREGPSERFDGYEDSVVAALSPLGMLLLHQDARRQLTSVQRRTAASLTQSTDTALIVDPDGVIQEAGPSAHVVLGTPDVQGKNLLDLVYGPDRADAEAALRVDPDDEPFKFRARVLLENGFLRPVEAVSRNLTADDAVAGFVVNIRDVSDWEDAETRLEKDARTDTLTGLLNRHHTLSLLTEMLAASPEPDLALLFCDLDGFKNVNDTLGHGGGDRVLRDVAIRLSDGALDGEIVGRFGGDEFVIICPGKGGMGLAEDRSRDIVRNFNEEFRAREGSLAIGVSVGIAVAKPGITAEDLLGNADAAMYEAKKTRSGYALFTESLHTASRDRLEMENDLRHASKRGQLWVAYQPVLDLKSGAIVGSEALMRWEHPVKGDVSPVKFIAAAERLGIIGDLGDFILREALAQQRRWMDDLGDMAPRFVAVNVSVHQLNSEDFTESVQRALADTGMTAENLTLEITESVLLDGNTDAIAVLNDLVELGVSLDIDDFGTGYSSLAYIVRLPVHALKVDRTFVDGLGHEDGKMAATVDALLTLVQRLKMRAVAEGVETAEQLGWLREHGCEMAQGFFVSRAVPAPDFARLVLSQQRW